MKLFCFLILLLGLSFCSPTIYKASNFANSKSSIHTLAILPFSVSMDLKRLPKGVNSENLSESQLKTGYSLQTSSYSWLLQRQKKYTVTFQDIDRTNALLNKANINNANIALVDKGELCKILGTDGIISGKALMSKPMSEGAAVVVGLFAGVWGSTNSTATTLTIHDVSGNLLWKYDYTVSGSIGSSSERLSTELMQNASRKFPFTK